MKLDALADASASKTKQFVCTLQETPGAMSDDADDVEEADGVLRTAFNSSCLWKLFVHLWHVLLFQISFLDSCAAMASFLPNTVCQGSSFWLLSLAISTLQDVLGCEGAGDSAAHWRN